MQRLILDFWERSINRTLTGFKFDKFFKEFTKKLKHKLSSHGQLTFNNYLDSMREYYNLNLLKKFEYNSKHLSINITHEDILESIFFNRYKIFKKEYNKSKTYKKMMNVYIRLLKYKSLNHTDKVLLVDRCISLQHNSNFIVELDIVNMRKNFENAGYN